ncbi:EscU/YscU/HrcU family type III secretion system export apparatus switch protein [Temperatibacter marinus]|uniref:EscU/YscU/HrcU family type III secretion system export apparatus switch protein n=1 Tax=Temperatibacter marinus TaxID=1456591 RepID=A0AA52EGK4_9PROT|nr:EscU/YscU/HrcU family type III secretion system export apparatus switch protein [Temperatibacter marinus]WND02142.1 EscU/YscU/HrcU family type III secretion system export apparatus switch protein [Temperatibacter marinus]
MSLVSLALMPKSRHYLFMTEKNYHTKEDILKRKAVALKDSDRDTMRPDIVAKGRGFLAERILDIAFDKDVKVRQDKALTDILDVYDVNSPIPLEALIPVSRILEYVYQANALKRKEAEKKNRDI